MEVLRFYNDLAEDTDVQETSGVSSAEDSGNILNVESTLSPSESFEADSSAQDNSDDIWYSENRSDSIKGDIDREFGDLGSTNGSLSKSIDDIWDTKNSDFGYLVVVKDDYLESTTVDDLNEIVEELENRGDYGATCWTSDQAKEIYNNELGVFGYEEDRGFIRSYISSREEIEILSELDAGS